MKNWILFFLLSSCSSFAAQTQISVLSAGARGNGTADDTAAIQKAIDDFSGASIYFPSGTYKVTTLIITNDVKLLGDVGSRIVQSATATDAMIKSAGTNSATIYISGLVLDGNAQNQLSRSEDVVNLSSIVATLHENKKLLCDNVTFTNTLRAGARVAGAATFNQCYMTNVKTNSCAGNGTPGDTYAIFAQPTGYNADLSLNVKNCTFYGQTGWDTNLVYLAAHGVFVTEQGNNSDTTLNTNRFTFTAIGNTFVGLGGWFGVSEGAAIEVYNGCNNPVIIGNQVYVFAQSGIKVQRSGNVVIQGNQVGYAYNAYTGDGGIYEGISESIIFDPSAREGFYPFVGPRTNELHYGAIIEGNMIQNPQYSGIYVTGKGAKVRNNTISGYTAAPHTSAAIAILNSDVEVVGNTFRDIPYYQVVASSTDGSYLTNLTVSGNMQYTTTATNTVGQYVFTKIASLQFSGNYANLSTNSNATYLYLNDVPSARVFNNYVEDNSTNISYVTFNDSTTAAQVIEWNNYPWRIQEISKMQPSLTDWEVVNLSTNASAFAGLRMTTLSAGGGMYMFPTNAGAPYTGRLTLIPDTTSTGIRHYLYDGQDFRLNFGSRDHMYMAPEQMYYLGTSSTPFVLESTNASAAYMVFKASGVYQLGIGYLAGVGFTVINSALSTPTFSVDDYGNATAVTSLTTPQLVASNIVTENFTVTSLTTSTLVSTNGVKFVSIATGPTAASIGAGNGQLWLSNSSPPTLYFRYTTDGVAATDKLLSP